ncbi:MAG: hypothetical protein VYE22_14270 [Myxococcota bacterium]|nr:hypothetical protein [Myxococcota bacterium]
MNAIAVLKVSPSVVFAALPEENGARRAQNGETVKIEPLEDAVKVHLGVSLTSEPEALAERMDDLLGELLDLHEPTKGVPVYPDSHALAATKWNEVVDELGAAADWIPVQAEDPMQALLGGMGGMDLGAMMQQMGGDPAALMQQAMQMAQQLAQSGDLGDLTKMMGGMQGGQMPDLGALADQARDMIEKDPGLEQRLQQQMEQMGGLDAMSAQAEAMLAQNPELAEKLRTQLGRSDSAPNPDPAPSPNSEASPNSDPSPNSEASDSDSE